MANEPIVRCREIVMVPISKLVPNPKNPNVHPPEQIERLADIIEFQGWRWPIKVSNRSGFISSGHGRLMAAELRGWKEVPVSFQDYDNEAQEYADVVSDNAIPEWAEMNREQIKKDIVEFGDSFHVELLGMQDFELDAESESEPIDVVPVRNIFEVVVSCKDEREQQQIFEELTHQGMSCRVLSM